MLLLEMILCRSCLYILVQGCCWYLVWDLKGIRAHPSTCQRRKGWWGTAVLTGPGWSRFRVLTSSAQIIGSLRKSFLQGKCVCYGNLVLRTAYGNYNTNGTSREERLNKLQRFLVTFTKWIPQNGSQSWPKQMSFLAGTNHATRFFTWALPGFCVFSH